MPGKFPMTTVKNNRRRRGAAIVEMAFVVIILLSLTMGIIQWAFIMNASIGITNLSREGARYAAVHWADADSDNKIKNYVKSDVPPGINADDLDILISPAEGSISRKSGDAITVTVTYDMSKKLFLPAEIFDVTFFSGTYKADGRMMME